MPQPKILNSALFRAMGRSAGKLSAFVLLCIVVLLIVRAFSEPKILQAEQENLLATFNQVLPSKLYDNLPLNDTTQIREPQYLKKLASSEPVTVYRARLNNQPAGVILQTIAPDGYSGNIYLLIGIRANGKISGVRVLKHRETPGLGDKIEIEKDNWITTFNQTSLNQPSAKNWAVKKDGGEFDQFTGATITPRAVVKAVRNSLEVVHQLGDTLYE